MSLLNVVAHALNTAAIIMLCYHDKTGIWKLYVGSLLMIIGITVTEYLRKVKND